MALPIPVARNRRIAVVDDSDAVRRSLLVLLGARGFDVDVFADGAQLLAALKAADYACFVIDLKLNGTVGTELLAQIREQGCRQPAVLISGWNVDSLDKIALQSGFSAYVRKPMMNTSIVDMLEQLLSPP